MRNFQQLFHRLRKHGLGVNRTRTGIDRFYDLGCGVGKPSFAAALLHDFDSVGGVEMLGGLVDILRGVIKRWHEIGKLVRYPDLLNPKKQSHALQMPSSDTTLILGHAFETSAEVGLSVSNWGCYGPHRPGTAFATRCCVLFHIFSEGLD